MMQIIFLEPNLYFRNIKLLIMKKILMLLCMYMFASCAQTDVSFEKKEEDEYAKTKETLEQKEKKNPIRFLKPTADYHRNIIGQTVVKGVVTNSATVAAYKNIRLKILYYDSEGNLFENHEELLDGELEAGEEIKFKAKYRTQKKTDSIIVSVMSAVAVE
jgi:hypothetical protein